MVWISNMNIGNRLFLGFSVIILFMGIIGLSGRWGMSRIRNSLNDISEIRLPGIVSLLEADRDLHQLLVAERSLFLADRDSDLFKRLLEDYEENFRQSAERLDIFRSLMTTPEEKAIFSEYEKARMEWESATRKVISGCTDVSADARSMAEELTLGRAKAEFDRMRGGVDALEELNLKIADEAHEDAEKIYDQIRRILLAIAGLGILSGMLIAAAIGKGIADPVRQAVDVAKAVALGDMTRKLTVSTGGEIGELAASLNQSTDDLAGLLIQIQENADLLAGASEEMSAVSVQLSGRSQEASGGIGAMVSAVGEMSVRAQEVSSTAEQMSVIMNSIASAIEEMSASISRIAQNAGQGAEISEKAMSMSEAATGTINGLGNAASEIGEVTEVIRHISRQTNLLALNATIEAASAGDAGKGFAVVANEIKELAGQSGQSAEDIARRIKGVQNSAEETIRAIADVSGIIGEISAASAVISDSVEKQAETAGEISANILQVNDGVGTIASSIAEIAKGANDISENAVLSANNVNDIASGTREVENSAADLAKVAARLQEMAGRFSV